MRPTPWALAEPYRWAAAPGGYHSAPGDDFGVFLAQCPATSGRLKIIATAGDLDPPEGAPRAAWEHVSVSLANRCPNWPEMSWVKHLFWLPEETVMQLHVPAAQHVNYHPYCLHLWRPLEVEIPRPPDWMVGPTTGPAPAGVLV